MGGMFSGIIQSVGRVVARQNGQTSVFFAIDNAHIAAQVGLGASVLVHGVCLTLQKLEGSVMTFEAMKVTIDKTMLGGLEEGSHVNLEPSLKLGDEIGGHFVFGHVDTVGIVTEVREEGESRRVTFQMDPTWRVYFAPEGSVAVDGVSLTVAAVGPDSFTVCLVEYTLEHTTLGALTIGNRVNVECDMLAKYVMQAVKKLV